MNLTRIKISSQQSIGFVTLVESGTGSFFDTRLGSELSEAFLQCGRDPRVRVIVLASEASTFFGDDDREAFRRLAGLTFDQHQEEGRLIAKLYAQTASLRKPLMGMIAGPATGHGLGLAALCDIVIAARESARFGFPETKLGLVSAAAFPFVIRKIGEGRTRDLAMEGRLLNADEAQTAGLVTAVTGELELRAETMKRAQDLAQNPQSSAASLIKDVILRTQNMSPADALDYCINVGAVARMTDETKRGLEALLNSGTKQS